MQTLASPEQVLLVILPLWWSPPLVTPSRQSLPRPLPVSPRVQLLPAPPSVAAVSEFGDIFGTAALVLQQSLIKLLKSRDVSEYPQIFTDSSAAFAAVDRLGVDYSASAPFFGSLRSGSRTGWRLLAGFPYLQRC